MKEPNWIKHIKEKNKWFFSLLEQLDVDEVKSLLRSNYFKREERNWYSHFYLPNRIIKEYIPLIGIVGAAYAIKTIIEDATLK